MGTREHAFRQVYETHGAAVRAYLARRVGAQHVDDLAAQTFMVAWRKLPLDLDEPLPWLYAVARREVLAHRRRAPGGERLVERLAALIPRHERSAAPPLVEPVLAPLLAGALARLSHAEKEALLLVAWEHLDHAQAARVVGCTTTAFAIRVSRARAKLRLALGEPAKEPSA
jgi:RNA polymerase sigma factor (sigma-70 family)